MKRVCIQITMLGFLLAETGNNMKSCTEWRARLPSADRLAPCQVLTCSGDGLP